VTHITWAMWPPSVTLRYGSTGNAVAVLQTALRNSGVRGIAVDKVFGSQTLTAVRNFQFVKGLQVDGIAGPNTRAALVALKDVT
jgi:peptidoglycan hydrolase-like protein with peptidoglycan-binding domain